MFILTSNRPSFSYESLRFYAFSLLLLIIFLNSGGSLILLLMISSQPPRKRKRRSGISKHRSGRDRKLHRENAIVAPGPAQRDRSSPTSQPAPNTSTSVPVSSSSNDKPPIQKQIKKLKNKVYHTQAKVAMKEKTVEVLLSHTKEVNDLHDQEVHASEKLKAELSSSEAQKDKALTLLADRTDRFSTALDKKNRSLPRSKVTTNKFVIVLHHTDRF